MTAPAASTATVYNNIRELGQVTNTFGGYITVGATPAAYTLQLPFQADKFEWWNYTAFGTNDKNISGVWFRDMPAGDMLQIQRGTTTLTSDLEGTNGITIANTGPGFATQNYTITGITAGVVTSATLTPVLNSSAPYSRILITQVVGTVSPQVNNQTFIAVPLTSTTFRLYDVFGVPITQVGSYTSGGKANLAGPSLGIVNAPQLFYLTLGTDIIVTAADVIYFQATQFNNYQNFGLTS